MKKAVIYARYSSAGQTEQSIEGQLRVCEKYAREHNFVIIDTYIDRARTAQNDNRPYFQQMLKDSESKKWQYVIVYAVDRFARDDGDYGADKKLLRNNGVKLLSATEITGTNPDGTENLGGILTEGVLVAVAKYYSRELSRKVKRGHFESLQKKNFLGGHIVYGYYAAEVEGSKSKKLEIDPEKAAVIKKIFTMYANGSTAQDIADSLKAEGIRNNYGRYFCKNTIMNILKNRKYTGFFKFGEQEFENYHPAIIDDNLFNICAEKITRRKRSVEKFKDYGNYILSGKLYCGHCKTLMYGESGTSKTGKIYHYYKCFNRKKNLGCEKKNIAQDYIEDLVFDIAMENLFKEDVVLGLIDNIVEAHNKKTSDDSKIKILKQQLKENQKFIDNLLNAIKNGIFSESTQAELIKLESQKKEIEESLAKKEAEKEYDLTREAVLFWIKSFSDGKSIKPEKKAQIINILIEAVILFDNRIVVVFKNGSDNKKALDIDDLIDNLGSSKKNYLVEEVVLFSNTKRGVEVFFTKHYIIIDSEL